MFKKSVNILNCSLRTENLLDYSIIKYLPTYYGYVSIQSS